MRRQLLVRCVSVLVAWSPSIADAQQAARGPAVAPSPPASGPCRVDARLVGEQEVTVGLPFTLAVEGHGPAGVTWSFPAQVDADGVELRTAPMAEGQKPTPGGQRYVGLAFAVGEVRVPPIAAECRLADGSRHEVRSEPLPVRMRSLLPKDPSAQRLEDIRPPLSLSVGAGFWLALAIVLIALTVGVALFVRRRRRVRGVAHVPAETVVPPDVEARLALSQLARDGPLRRDDLRGHYIALTQVAKRYLERRLEAPVVEMTSAETVAYLRRHAQAERLLGGMRTLVSSADQVKFARGLGAREEGERDLEAVGAMIEALEEALRPASAGASGKGVSG
jgi:hypothetical protein